MGKDKKSDCFNEIHPDHLKVLEMVRTELPTDEMLCDLADLYKVFGDTTRIKILFALTKSEMCVCALANLIGMNQPAVSHQLKLLKDANLVGNRREGKTIFYYLADEHVTTVIVNGFEHLLEKMTEKRTEKRSDK